MSATQSGEEKLFPGQHEGEAVQIVFRQHPLVMRKALILGLLMILVAVTPLAFPQVYSSETASAFFLKGALVTPVVVVLVWFYRWVGWYYTIYLVTDRRILEVRQRGLFDRKVEEWQLDAINSVNYHINGFQAVLFGYGDITARSYIGDFEMKTIHRPAEIHEKLVEAVRKAGGGSTRSPN